MTRKHLVILLLGLTGLVAVLVASATRRPAVRYSVTFLPTLGGSRTDAHDLNDRGQVVGVSDTPNGEVYMFFWDPQQGLRVIGRSDEPPHVGGLSVNDSGQIAGTVTDANGNPQAFLAEVREQPPGSFSLDKRMLGTLGGPRSMTESLNNRGQVVGTSETAEKLRHAFLWDPAGGMRDLGTLGGPVSVALNINDAGQVVGFAEAADRTSHIVLWDPGPIDPNSPFAGTGGQSAVAYTLTDLGIAGVGPYMCDINNNGLVIRRLGTVTGKTYFTTWTRATGPRKLDFVAIDSGIPCGLNEAGQFLVRAGPSRLSLFGRTVHRRHECYLLDPDRGPRLLQDCLSIEDITSLIVRELNNQGQIIATMQTKGSNEIRAAVLEPVRK